jgi:DNA excision repair protein ERCC-2
MEKPKQAVANLARLHDKVRAMEQGCQKSPKNFRTGIREMVEFVHRRGNLAGEGGFRASNRATEGTRLHRLVQKRRGAGYEAEVSVEFRSAGEEIECVLHGRVDGLQRDCAPPMVEEIKTVDRFWKGTAEPLHVAQLRIYAAILARQNNWQDVELRLTHVDLESGRETVIPFQESQETLSAFLEETLGVWREWLAAQSRWKRLRDDSIAGLGFPFTRYREGQREMARRVYRAIREKRTLFLEAPTGLGKTMGTIYPAVRALPLLEDGRVFFLTAKTPGRHAAAAALEALRGSGARLRSVALTAKQTICFSTDPGGCDPRACPFALGYHDRIRTAVESLLARESMDRAAVEEVARAHTVCPFELSLDASSWSDVVVGDFNHLFDPSARLQRHFGAGPADHVALVDEAHNLVDRSRDMHSAILTPEQLVVGRGAVRAKGGASARRALAEAGEALRLVSSSPTEEMPEHHNGKIRLEELPKPAVKACRAASTALEKVLTGIRPGAGFSGWIEPWFALQDWLRAAEAFDETCHAIRTPDGGVSIFCADPSARLRKDLEGLRSAVFFSATLSPPDYFSDLLGGKSGDEFAVFDSPFDPERMRLRVLTRDVTFKAREASLTAVARDVLEHIESAPGNHLVFCPSMGYLAALRGELENLAPGMEFIAQEPSMQERKRQDFLDAFQPGSRVVALVVVGGIFAEGVDLPGERLKAVTVVGTGLPRLSLERDLLRHHFEKTRGRGFDYAYRIPGMQRVQQAVGRLIRTEEDSGSALLIDARFLDPRQRSLFPAWWRPEFPG